jgi:hypothetical protein
LASDLTVLAYDTTTAIAATQHARYAGNLTGQRPPGERLTFCNVVTASHRSSVDAASVSDFDLENDELLITNLADQAKVSNAIAPKA